MAGHLAVAEHDVLSTKPWQRQPVKSLQEFASEAVKPVRGFILP
jgi:hypothetical protein